MFLTISTAGCAEDVGTLDLTIKSSPCPDKLMNPADHVPANSAGN